jgi:cell division protein FtsQ
VRRLNRTLPRRSAVPARIFRVCRWLAFPALAVLGVGSAAVLGLPHRIAEIGPRTEAWLIGRSAALGLRVAGIRVEGGATTDRATILAALGAGLGSPILAVDPARAEARLEALPWVSSAVIERRLPDKIYVRLNERRPLALWQHDGRVQLIDEAGAVIRVAKLDRFAKLPLVVGPDAAGHAAPLLAMLAREPDLDRRVTAAVRVGGRRWNLRIDGRIEVLLPAGDASGAWAALARLERSQAILDREVEVVDMRLDDRLVVRVAPQPPRPPVAPVAGKPRPPAKNT